MGNPTPFAKDSLLKEMHRCTIEYIRRPAFAFTLPKLNAEAWKIICTDPQARERLEFLGDSLIGTTVSEGLIQRWPSENPDFYTKCRTVLVANYTFAYLMWKAGICKLDKDVKPAGDAFEAILALYHEKHGLKNFKRYIYESFGPLFNVVGESYHENLEKFRMSHKRRHQMQLHDRRLNQAAKSAKELTSSVYRRHDSRNSMKPPLVNKKQRIYENRSPQKTPKRPTTSHGGPTTPSQPELRPRNVVDLTQISHDHQSSDKKSLQGLNSSNDEDVSSRKMAPNGPFSFAIKPEPSSPTFNKDTWPPSSPKEFLRAPFLPHKPLHYPTFTPKQIIDSQTQDILITASNAASEPQNQNHMQPPLPVAVASPAPPHPKRRNDTTSGPSPTNHRRMASGTTDDLADMFASQATLAQSVPSIDPALVHGTKDNPITILDDDNL